MSDCGSSGFNSCNPCGGGGAGNWTGGGWTGGPIEAGPGLHIQASGTSFVFKDGKLDPDPQTIEFVARVSGVETAVTWIVEPSVKNLADSSTLSLTSTEVGQRRFVIVTATAPNGEARSVFVNAAADPFATVGAPFGTPVGTKLAEELIAEVEETRDRVTGLVSAFGSSQSAEEALIGIQLLKEQIDLAKDQADTAVTLTDQARDDAISEAQRAFAEAERALNAANSTSAEITAAVAAALQATQEAVDLAQTARNNAIAAATAASGSATQALTYKEEALEAAQTATEAASSAQSASGIATTAQINAENAAASSVSNASIANSKATEAAQSAAAASASSVEASTAAGSASSSATQAATSRNDAQSAATSATSSASNAATAANSAGQSATAAASSASVAAAAVTEAEEFALSSQTSANTATTKAGEASTSAGSAATSATTAAGSASTATTQANNAAQSANAAGDSATAASGSASVASTKATEASQSAVSATQSANTATTKAGEASTSATSAATSATNAAGSASTATTQATNAANAANAAGASAGAASTSASTATAKANEAEQFAASAQTSANTATTQAGNASTSASQAASSATNAAGSASTAGTQASNAASSANAAGASATAANSSANLASTKASEASQSAISASTSANTAQTEAGKAETSAGQAAISRFSAESEANRASSFATLTAATEGRTKSLLDSTFRYDFNDGDGHWVGSYTQDVDALPTAAKPSQFLGAVALVTVPGIGQVLQGNGYTVMSERKVRPVVPGQFIRIRIRTRLIVDRADPSPHLYYLWIVTNNADGTYSTYPTLVPFSGLKVSDGWVTHEHVFSPAQVRGGSPWAYWRVMLGLNGYPNVSASGFNETKGEVQQFAFVEVDDVTSEKAAQDWASAASVSASQASTFADAAGVSAAASNNSNLSAQTAASNAAVSRNEAVVASQSASGSAAAALTNATLSASIGGNLINANSRFTRWPDSPGLPTYWYWWNVNQISVEKIPSPSAAQGSVMRISCGALENGILQPWYEPATGLSDISPGRYVAEVEFKLIAGDLLGGSYLIQFFDANGQYQGERNILFTEMSGGSRQPSGWVNFSVLFTIPASVRAVIGYLLTNWTGNGPLFAEKDLHFRKVGIRPATAAEITTGTVLPAVEASVSQLQGAIADVNGSAAFLETKVAASGGNPAMMLMKAGKNGSGFGIVADRIALANYDNSGLPVDGLVIESGTVYFQGLLRANSVQAGMIAVNQLSALSANLGVVTAGLLRSPSGQTRIDLDNGQIIFNNGSFMKVTGNGFGSNNQFVEWFGPSNSNLATCTESNGIQWLKIDGSAYFGGTLSAGIISNAVQTTTVQADNVMMGPFTTNGRPAGVISTASASVLIATSSTTWIAGSPPPDPYSGSRQNFSAQFVLERADNENGPWTLIDTFNTTATSTTQTVNAGTTGGSEPQPLRRYRHVAGVGISASSTLTLAAGSNKFLRIRRVFFTNTTLGQPAQGIETNTISIRYTEP